MAGVETGFDHGLVLQPSWPASARFPRRLTSPQVRRRVDAAQRQALRSAVMLAAAATAVFVVADALRSAQFLGQPGRDMAVIQLGELILIGLLTAAAHRRTFRMETITMALAALVYGVLLVRLWLLPESGILSVGYMVTVLVGTGLFLPWSSRWHAAWLGTAVGMTALALLVLPGLAAALREPWSVVMATGSAAGISFLGQRIWQLRHRGMLEQQFELREMNRHTVRQEMHVTALNAQLNLAVRRDTLTGVGNRLALDEALAALIDPTGRLRPTTFALVLVDIDHFKSYNDQHGHLVGDAALERFGELLRATTRGGDMAFRYGGEEFLLLLPGLALDAAMRVAERLRLAVERDRGELPAFTVSAGVALWDPADGRDPGPLLRRADAALYRAKGAGRNRVAADELSVAAERVGLASVG